VQLNAGQTQRVTVTVEDRAFKYWAGRWAAAAGTNQILVSSSSRAVKLTGQVTIPPDSTVLVPGTYTAFPQNAANNSMALDDRGSSTAAGNPIVIWTPNNSGAQRWVFSTSGVAPAGNFKVAVSLGNFCLTASGTTSESPAQLHPCSGASSQSWRATPANGGYTLRPANNDALCLDVKGAGIVDETVVQVYTCNNTAAQRWNIK
jgi:beta-glucosidase